MLKNTVSVAGEGRCSLAERLFRIFTPQRIKSHPWDEDQRAVFLEDLDIARGWIVAFPEPPDFASKHVVEIGCGFGALCVQAALDGAKKVLGVELDTTRAGAAGRAALGEHPELKDTIEFTDYASIEGGDLDRQFDIVLSQNSFEHYEDPEKVLGRMAALLRPGGHIYAGFGPLWHSPYGSHLRSICPLPWAHLWAGDLLLGEHNRLRSHDPRRSWGSFGLNLVPFSTFREIFHGLEGCTVIHFCHNRPLLKRSRIGFLLLEIFRALPPLREYLTMSLFAVVRKDHPAKEPRGMSGREGNSP